ncbi:MAG: proton-conducting transporter membrane subunit [Chloroflexota bacterium]
MSPGAMALLAALGLLVVGGVLGAASGRSHAARTAAAFVVAAAGVAILALGVAVIAGAPVTFQAGSILGVAPLDARYDALSGAFLLPLGALVIAAGGYAAGYHGAARSPLDAIAFAVFIGGMLLVLGAANVLAFLLAWELMAVSSALLVFGPRPDRAVAGAGYLYLAVTHIATAAIAVAFAILVSAAGTFDTSAFPAAAAALPDAERSLLFVLLLAGFGTKAGLVPLHVWLPEAHPVAPSHVSALMSGVMVTTGIYGLLRFAVAGLGAGPAWWGLLVLAIGVVSAILGALYALAERDLKRLLAFSTIENMGLVLLGVGTAMLGMAAGSAALATIGLTAALLHLVNHALFKGLLFLGAGSVQEAAGTRDLDRLGGLIRLMPATGFLVLVGAVAAASLPPLNGFSGEWLTFRALLEGGGTAALGEPSRFALYLAVGGLALTAALALATFVKASGMTFLALPRSEAAAAAHEVGRPMRAAMAGLAIACVAAGVLAAQLGELLGGVADATLSGAASAAATATATAGAPGPVTAPPPGTIPSYGPALLAIALALACVAAWAIVHGRRATARRSLTWTCGVLPDPAYEYTATSFEKPARLFYEPIYRAQRELEVERHPGTPFPSRIEYRTAVDHALETHVYGPAHRLSIRVAQVVRRVQHGSLQLYLAYIVAAVIVLLLVARI